MDDMAHSDVLIPVPPIGVIMHRTRKSLGMKQEELAIKLGELGWDRPTHFTVYKIEAGTRSVSAHEVAMLAHALGVTMAYLLGESERKRKSRQDVDE